MMRLYKLYAEMKKLERKSDARLIKFAKEQGIIK